MQIRHVRLLLILLLMNCTCVIATRKTRKDLTLKEKVAVLEYMKRNPGSSSRKISSVFNCGKTQIQSILRTKDEILDEFEKNGPDNRKTQSRR